MEVLRGQCILTLRTAKCVHRGKAIINSIMCRPERYEKMIPIAVKYKANMIALMWGPEGLPRDENERGAEEDTGGYHSKQLSANWCGRASHCASCSSTAASVRSKTLGQELRDLHDAHERGIITDAGYEEKSGLLDRD